MKAPSPRKVRDVRAGDLIEDPEIDGTFRVRQVDAGSGRYRGKFWLYLDAVDGVRQVVLFRDGSDPVGLPGSARAPDGAACEPSGHRPSARAPRRPGEYLYTPAAPALELLTLRVEVVLREGVLMVRLPQEGERALIPVADLPGSWTPG